MWVCVVIQTKDRAGKFERFVAENELKRRRALRTYEATREQNVLKRAEIEELGKKLRELQTRWERQSEALMLGMSLITSAVTFVNSQRPGFKRESCEI